MKRVTRTDEIKQPAMAQQARERMNERLLRNDGTRKKPVSAKEARERMIKRHDGSAADDTQEALSEMMRTPVSEAYKNLYEGDVYDRMQESILREILGGPNDTAPKPRTLDRTPEQARQEMINRRSGVRGTGAEPDTLRKGGNQAELARARMLDRLSGACPDRLPKDYNPLPSNDR